RERMLAEVNPNAFGREAREHALKIYERRRQHPVEVRAPFRGQLRVVTDGRKLKTTLELSDGRSTRAGLPGLLLPVGAHGRGGPQRNAGRRAPRVSAYSCVLRNERFLGNGPVYEAD